MSAHLARARILSSQHRFEQAVEEYRSHLLHDPEDEQAHFGLALALAEQKKFDAALLHAKQTIALAPEWSGGHYALAAVQYRNKRPRECRTAIDEAIAIDGPLPHLMLLRGSLSLNDKEWQAALNDADLGLTSDPENDDLLNLRAQALIGLGRRLEATESLEAALQRDPENAFTHATQGWTLLEKGLHEKAMLHFREALRLEPDMEYARLGIINSLKAKHFLYRIFLGYVLWMAKLKAQYQFGLIIGAWLGIRFVGNLGDQNPALRPYLTPLLIAYFAFVLLTWIAIPLFNLVLRTNRIGRLALNVEETRGANLLGANVLLCLGMLVGWVATSGDERFERATLYTALLLIPVSSIYMVQRGFWRMTVALFCLGMCLVACSPLFPGVVTKVGDEVLVNDLANSFYRLYTWAILLYSFAINAIPRATRS